MKIYSLLTGRGNNTLKDKNILRVLGHPVLFYPSIAVKNSKLIEKHFCSSDDDKILSEAEKIGFSPIIRPLKLSGPTSQHIDCIFHALSVIKNTTDLPDILVVVLANNITLKTKWIDDCIKLMKNDMNISAVVPVYLDNDHHPFRAKCIDKNGNLVIYDKRHAKNASSTNRQDLPKCYFLAHNIWVLNVNLLLKNKSNGDPPWSFMGKNVKPYLIDESIDIHDLDDLERAKIWLRNNGFDNKK